MAVIDTATNMVSKTVDTMAGTAAHSPWAVASISGTKSYATMNGAIDLSTANTGNDIAMFDSTQTTPTVSYVTVGAGPHGIIASPDKSTVYVAAQKAHEVWKVTVGSNSATKLATIAGADSTAPGFPTDLAVSADGKKLVAVNHDKDNFVLLNSADGSVIATVDTGTGSQPWGGIVIDNKLYVSTSGLSTISVFDIASATVTEKKKITVGHGPDGFALCKF